MSLKENFKVSKGARFNQHYNTMANFWSRNFVMLPSKFLVNLIENNRISKFDLISYTLTAIMFTRGLNSLVFLKTEDSKWPQNTCKIFGRFLLSQMGSVYVLGTLLIFFTYHEVPLDANYVQINYEKYGIWGETYSREAIDNLKITSMVLWVTLVIIAVVQAIRYSCLTRLQRKKVISVEKLAEELD